MKAEWDLDFKPLKKYVSETFPTKFKKGVKRYSTSKRLNRVVSPQEMQGLSKKRRDMVRALGMAPEQAKGRKGSRKKLIKDLARYVFRR